MLIPETGTLFFNDLLWITLSGVILKKRFRRFWRYLYAYQSGQNYSQVLQIFFSHLRKVDVSFHRKITNTNLN